MNQGNVTRRESSRRAAARTTDVELLPLVTIGLITYNPGPHLDAFLASVKAQDEARWSMLIVDDGSTDGSREKLESWVTTEERAKLRLNRTNQGSAANFNWVVLEAKTEYVVWTTGHDLWHPAFLSSLTRALDNDGDAVIACPSARFITLSGEDGGAVPAPVDTRGLKTRARYMQTLYAVPRALLIYGLIRRDALLKTNMIRDMYAADNALLSELALLGTFIHTPQERFFWRDVRKPEPFEDSKNRTLDAMSPGRTLRRRTWTHKQLMREYMNAQIAALRASTLSSSDRRRAIMFTRFHHASSWGFLRPIRRAIAKSMPTSMRQRLRNVIEPQTKSSASTLERPNP